jgi:hypothetical protein
LLWWENDTSVDTSNCRHKSWRRAWMFQVLNW